MRSRYDEPDPLLSVFRPPGSVWLSAMLIMVGFAALIGKIVSGFVDGVWSEYTFFLVFSGTLLIIVLLLLIAKKKGRL
jgi:predicted MFS family arabinose efflux permease